MTDERGVIAYVRALERHLERFHEPPFVLSPKDWTLAEEWHGRGVPLHLIVECLEAHGERRPRGGRLRRPPKLTHVRAEVEEGWAVIQQGRLSAVPVPPPAEARGLAAEQWERAAERIGRSTPLGTLLVELLALLRSGADAGGLDARLDRAIEQSVAADVRDDARRAVDAELLPFRDRWDRATYEETHARTLRARIRRRLGLPRLASGSARARPSSPAQE